MPYTKRPRTFYKPYHCLTRQQKWRRRKQAERDQMLRSMQEENSLKESDTETCVFQQPNNSDDVVQ